MSADSYLRLRQDLRAVMAGLKTRAERLADEAGEVEQLPIAERRSWWAAQAAEQAALIPMRRAATDDYAALRRQHWDTVYAAITGYLDSNLPVTRYRNLAARAVVAHFPEAFYAAYADASGADTVAADDDAWLTGRINEEIEHVRALFDGLRDVRAAGGYEADAIARRHADGYAGSLDNVRDEGRLRGNTNVMLTYDGPDGDDSCRECRRYKGQRHRARWWIERDLVRRNGNEQFGCGRWANCRHHYYADNGRKYAD